MHDGTFLLDGTTPYPTILGNSGRLRIRRGHCRRARGRLTYADFERANAFVPARKASGSPNLPATTSANQAGT